MIRLKLFLLILVMLTAFAGCKKQEAPKSYKLIDTGMWTSAPGGPFRWLDNERVLFPSNEKLAPGGGASRMTVWKPASGKVEFFHPWSGGFCVEAGEITFAVTDNSTRKVSYYRGPIENPHEYPPPRTDMYMRKNFGCGWVDKDSRESQALVPFIIKLRDGNFLEVTAEEPNSEPDPQGLRKGAPIVRTAAYREREGAEAMKLPFLLNGWDGYYPKYIKWRDAYLVATDSYYPGRRLRLWWIERNGQIREEKLPESLPFPSAGGISFHPVKGGLFIRYNGASSKGLSGGYLLKNGSLEHVINHFVQSEELSPDGCKLVFDHASESKEYYAQKKPHRTLKMIDFCTQGGKQ